jgi:hypothetical protein
LLPIGNSIAEFIEAVGDMVPKVTTPNGYLASFFRDAPEIGNVLLSWLAVDPLAFGQDGCPGDVDEG